MSRNQLPVTQQAFHNHFERLVANFDPHLDDAILQAIEREYRRLFALVPGGTVARDDLLEQVATGLIEHRRERGMPRLAEVTDALDRVLQGETLIRLGFAARDTLRILQEGLSTPNQRAERRAALERATDHVAKALGAIQQAQRDDAEGRA